MPKPRNKKKRREISPRPAETAAAEALTAAWTLTVITVLLCDAGAAAARLYFHARPDAAAIGILSGVLFFAAAVLGVVSLVLLPVVYRIRREGPPRGFVIFALVAALAPLAALAVLSLR